MMMFPMLALLSAFTEFTSRNSVPIRKINNAGIALAEEPRGAEPHGSLKGPCPSRVTQEDG